MIPKKIHYCWFGGNPKPKIAEKCIKSWRKYCPDYEIVEWNEKTYDLTSAPLYVRQAYDAKKWAFVTDYVRLKVVYDHGGVYMDTDVELKKNLDPFLEYGAYFGFEEDEFVATGLGFGAEKNFSILKEMMEDYLNNPFVREDGSYDTEPCPHKNTRVLCRHGLALDGTKQLLEGNVLILPEEYLCPISYGDLKKKFSDNTVSIHWFTGSWQSTQAKTWMVRKRRLSRFIGSRRAETILGIWYEMNKEGYKNYLHRHIKRKK